jgi:hypothetical protein
MLAWRAVAASVLFMMAAGCGAGPANTAGVQSQVGPSPVVLADTSPGQLQVSVMLSTGGYDVATRENTRIDVAFSAGGHPVKFVSGERVTCDSVGLIQYTGTFEGTFVTAVIAGKPLTCRYLHGAKSSSIEISVPKRFVVLSPREHDVIPRGTRTVVTFDAATSSGLWGVVALGPMSKAVAHPDAITAGQATLDTTGLQAGTGSLAFTLQPGQLRLAAPEFKAVSGSAQSSTMIAVTWV